jgi:CBS domain containing-hemolysin-like protein
VIPFVVAAGSLDLPIGLAIALSAVFLTLSFFFSGTETAMFSLQKLQRQRLEHTPLGQRVNLLLERRTALITTILIGNETVNVAFASTGAQFFEHLTPWEWLNPWLSVLIVTPVLVLFSEITPKIVAFRFNVLWATAAVWPITLFAWAVAPVRLVVTGIVSVLARGFGVRGAREDRGLGEAELMNLIDQGTRAGNVDEHEREMIEAVLDFDELTIGRLMTPRPDIFAVSLRTPWPDIVQACREQGYSRIPVYDREIGDIIGVLLLKDVLKYRDKAPGGLRQLRAMLLQPIFVPPSKSADDMLQLFLERRSHQAFVVDEHGTLVGLVTLDDLLGELFGEIPDEGDEPETAVLQTVAPGSYVVQATMDVEEFSEEVALKLPEGEYTTLGGFVFHQLGRVPHKGDAFTWSGHRFVVRRMDGRRVAEVTVRRLEESDGEAPGSPPPVTQEEAR